jgi:hypothetical protein
MKPVSDEVRAQISMGVYFCPGHAEWQHYQHGVRDALAPYGDWRVVEGMLVTGRDAEPSVATCTILREDNGVCHVIGTHSERVKLLLPPEEPAPDKRTVERDALLREIDVGRARADRYEQALREIALATTLDGRAKLFGRLAREALDDC